MVVVGAGHCFRTRSTWSISTWHSLIHSIIHPSIRSFTHREPWQQRLTLFTWAVEEVFRYVYIYYIYACAEGCVDGIYILHRPSCGYLSVVSRRILALKAKLSVLLPQSSLLFVAAPRLESGKRTLDLDSVLAGWTRNIKVAKKVPEVTYIKYCTELYS